MNSSYVKVFLKETGFGKRKDFHQFTAFAKSYQYPHWLLRRLSVNLLFISGLPRLFFAWKNTPSQMNWRQHKD